MPKTMTQFDLLISCPSDVKKELELIKEVVETFNRTIGAVNNARMELRHWSTDSYPEPGDSPQNILNKQFVFSCDAAVAVFWTRFGTPTDEYGSGTEEEIEELIKSGKQVFLYFSDCPTNPSTIDHDQYKKILAFREKYKNKGLYWPYSNMDDFKRDFLNHLSLYFLRLFEEGGSQNLVPSKSNLCIKGVKDGQLTDNATTFHRDLLNSQGISNLKESILSTFDEIKGVELPVEKVVKEQSENGLIGMTYKPDSALFAIQEQIKNLGNIFPSKPVNVDEYKDLINAFAKQNDIDFQNDFFYLGKLTTMHNPIGGGPYGMGPSNSLSGSDDEKRKYELLRNLYEKIKGYNQLIEYFTQIDDKSYLNLALCNIGSDYDEDIDVKLYVKKGHICSRKQIPFPGDDIIEIANKAFQWLHKPQKNVVIDEYPDYIVIPTFPSITSIDMLGSSYENKINKEKNVFCKNRDRIFCYEYFEETEYDVICFNQKYLKQNTNSHFPSYLVFESYPGIIKYQITSKRCPDVIKGELICEEIM